MKSAFDIPRGSANFERIAPRKPDDYLVLSEVYHKTFLKLDEEGTEAAAATAIALVAGGNARAAKARRNERRSPPSSSRFDMNQAARFFF